MRLHPTGGSSAFDAALTGRCSVLRLDDGRELPLAVDRWHRRARGADWWLLDRCAGPSIDLGCGPGRLVRALIGKGVAALGVDISRIARRQCARSGAPAIQRNIFAELPGEGHWQHVIVADGNIGIGGDPLSLLRRAAALLRTGGRILVETAPAGYGLWRGKARLAGSGTTGAWFRWAVVGAEALPALALAAGLRIVSQHQGQRCFFELEAGLPVDGDTGRGTP